MRLKFTKVSTALLLILASVAVCRVPNPVHAAADVAALCDHAAEIASDEYGVPTDLMFAISRTETGQTIAGALNPWPWATNVQGAGNWLPTKAQALEHIRKVRHGGIKNFDVGCFQVNYKWHGRNFKSLEDMFDPLQNARYAAKFLKTLFAEHQDWMKATGAYHSRNTSTAAEYLNRFRPILARVSENARRQKNTPERFFRSESAPLLRGQSQSTTTGSLFPNLSKSNEVFIPVTRDNS